MSFKELRETDPYLAFEDAAIQSNGIFNRLIKMEVPMPRRIRYISRIGAFH